MTHTLLSLLLLVLLLPACGCDDGAAPTDMERAVAAAREAALEHGHSLETHRLVGAQQFVHEGRYVWRVTWKPKHLLPDDPSTGKIGAGGELFVNVVLETGEATIGFGE